MAVVSIGSGVVTDITKHACFLFQQTSGLPLTYIVVQTANSVSAFTSNMAPVFVDGVKRTLPSRYPDALVCDLETLRDAPLEMTLAGAGDMLAAFVSLPDYYLAHSLGMEENWSDLPEALLGDLYGLLFENAAAIRERTLEGMSLLAKLIALGGLAMSLSHATTPMSGYEHVVSHVLDLMNEIDGKPLAMHGSQVALAGVLCAAAYQEFLDGYDPGNPAQAFTVPAPEEMRKNIRSEFNAIDSSGAAAEECWHDYSLKLTHWAAIEPSLGGFKSRWNETKAALRRLTRTSEEIRALLEKLGAPPQFSRLSPAVSEAQARKAFLAAPLMRKRLTLGDLFIFQNWDRASLWERIWKSAGQDS
jgi:glycerol-1-phosphate dehydrogenase [NAD(P)+]